MRQDLGRRDGQLPPARRRRDLRRAGAPRPALRDAHAARGRAGQLRQRGRRQPGRRALHRGPADGRRRGADGGARRGRGGLPRQLRRHAARARGAARALPQPAGQRRLGHRGGHGDVDPAAQRGRALRRLPAPHPPPQRARRRAAAPRPGPRLPHRRGRGGGARGHRARLPHGARRLPAARDVGARGSGARPVAGRRHRDPLRRAQGAAGGAPGGADPAQEAAHPRRRARRVGRGHPPGARAALEGRGPGRAHGNAVPAVGPRGPGAAQHERADRRAHAQGLLHEGGAARLPRPPARGAGTALAPPARADRGAARGARGLPWSPTSTSTG